MVYFRFMRFFALSLSPSLVSDSVIFVEILVFFFLWSLTLLFGYVGLWVSIIKSIR